MPRKQSDLGNLVYSNVLRTLRFVAVVKATSVEKLWYQGQHAEAEKAAAEAKKWAMWGAGAALVFCLLYIVLYLGIFGIDLLSEM